VSADSLNVKGALPYADDCEHIGDELFWLDLVLKRRVALFRASLAALEPGTGGQQMFISHAEIEQLLGAEADAPSHLAELDREIAETRALIDARIAQNLESGTVPALVQIARMFQLMPFEQKALVICLAPELDDKYDKIYAYLHDDVGRKRPSLRLILDLLCRTPAERWRARAVLTDRGALLHMGVLQAWDEPGSSSGASDYARFLRLDPSLLNFVLGVGGVDARLGSAAFMISPGAEQRADADDADAELERRLRTLIERRIDPERVGSGQLVVNLYGPRDVGRLELARALCRGFGWELLYVDLEALVDAAEDVDTRLALALRQALLAQVPVYLDNLDAALDRAGRGDALARRLASQIARYCRLAFVASTRPRGSAEWFEGLAFHQIAVPFPDAGRRQRVWQRLLGSANGESSDWPSLLARQFRLTSRQISDALNSARNECTIDDREPTLDRLTAACRAQSHQVLSDLATRIDPNYRWEQLVLPADKLERLKELCAQHKHRYRVFEEWGFGARLSHGKGLSALFTGSPGTGKTMASEVVARELGLDLYKVDLSAVVSKYIGETEKNLSKIFREAESSNAILFFDEADALFGKRTEVSDAHDRYANVETSYLLQKMEEYDGIVILASNLRENMDEAFVRRLRFIVDFPFPDEVHRARIWQTHFPEAAPVSDDLDFGLFAQKLQVAGGSIKNIALNAAFLAAEEGSAIGVRHVLASARREYEKIGKRWDDVQMSKFTHEAA
jgi:hypothetical protein